VQRILAPGEELIGAVHSNKTVQAIRRCNVCQEFTNENKIKLAKSQSAFYYHHVPTVPNTYAEKLLPTSLSPSPAHALSLSDK